MPQEEFDEYEKLHPPFEPVISALLDESNPFPATYLHRFSDMSPDHLRLLKPIWGQVSVSRRRALWEDLDNLTDSDTLVSFLDFGKFALKDEDPRVRKTVIHTLWGEEDRELPPLLLNILKNDPDTGARAAAAGALGFFVYLGEMEEISPALLEKIENALIYVFETETSIDIQRKALEALGFSSRPEVPPLIEKAYREKNPEWISTALFAMGRSADQHWKSKVMKNLNHPEMIIRLDAIRSAGELDLKAAREPIMSILENEDEAEVRYVAIWALSEIGGEGVQDLFEELLAASEDDDEIDILEEAQENLSFNESTGLFDLIDIEPDEETFEEIDQPEPQEKKKKHRHKGKGE